MIRTAGIEIPETCIPDLSVSFDVNRDWPCKRAAFVAMLAARKAEIQRMERRLARTRSASGYRNLAAWIADAQDGLVEMSYRAPGVTCTCRESGLYDRPQASPADA